MIYTSREVYEYISKQTSDPIVERKTCAISGTQFPIYQSDLDFYTKISPTFAGEKFQIPTPSLCPEERQRRRLSFRNERKLYRRQCDASKKSIISIYSPDKPYKVYDQSIWWSDARDPMDYGFDFDFTKSFTEQFGELMMVVPKMSLFVTSDATENNCLYANYAGHNKNGYYLFDSDYNENSYYSNVLKNSNHCLDMSSSINCENCFQMIYSVHCYSCLYGIYCNNCAFCMHCISCMNCEYCFHCEGMVNKKYCIYNKQFTKEGYFEELKNIQKTYTYIKQPTYCTVHNVLQTCENIVGSNLIYTKNVKFAFDCTGLNIGSYCSGVMNGTGNVYDHDSFGEGSEYTLECEGVGSSITRILYSQSIIGNCSNIMYSYSCSHNSSHLFGCIGLRNKQYCIFNKQYTKEDYEIMVGKIIRHMMQPCRDALSARPGETYTERGEFFHPSLSPFGYNETVAQEYYPIEIQNSKLKIQNGNIDYSQFGYRRSTYSSDPKIPDAVKTIDCRLAEWAEDSEQWKQLNQMIVGMHGNASVVGDLDVCNTSLQQNYDICKQIILCELSGRPFMLQKAEIDFYRKHHITLPRKHPDVRHEERMKLRPGRILYLRNCDCCNKEMLSVYPVGTHGNASGLSGETSNVDRERSLDSDVTDSYLASGGQQQVYCESCYQKEVYG